MASKGAVAAGDIHTARAAAEVLKAGGNAFDAAVAALFAASLAEPVLSSLGGGGFLLAKPAGGQAVLYDFFAHTPVRKKSGVDFVPIVADFGTVTQDFHIGMGSIATPGQVKGAFEVHRDLGSMGMADIVAPAQALARDGVALSPVQADIFKIVQPIYTATPACRAQYVSPQDATRLIGAGEILRVPAAADFMEALAREGDDLFYRGEVAAQVALDCKDQGGHLERADFERYEVIKRAPLSIDFEGVRILTNPPPAVGGILVAFALDLIRDSGLENFGFGSYEHLERLIRVMALTHQAQVESAGASMLSPDFLGRYRAEILGQPSAHRGTTHISVIDALGNAASLTLSNGEGSAYMVPGTGVVFNNMLGEEDINPCGFHRWPEDTRLSSMMAPCLIEGADGRLMALGSGGSKRIRTAILQAVLNVLTFEIHMGEAVALPRLHFEGGVLNVEPGFDEGTIERLGQIYDEIKVWDEHSMFFGGVHGIEFNPRLRAFTGGGDPRRGGVVLVV